MLAVVVSFFGYFVFDFSLSYKQAFVDFMFTFPITKQRYLQQRTLFNRLHSLLAIRRKYCSLVELLNVSRY